MSLPWMVAISEKKIDFMKTDTRTPLPELWVVVRILYIKTRSNKLTTSILSHSDKIPASQQAKNVCLNEVSMPCFLFDVSHRQPVK
jgi:hypothetical protein